MTAPSKDPVAVKAEVLAVLPSLDYWMTDVYLVR